jgi:hypothetical protein
LEWPTALLAPTTPASSVSTYYRQFSLNAIAEKTANASIQGPFETFGNDLCLLDAHLLALLVVDIMFLLPQLIVAMTTATISLVHAEIYFGG